MATPYPINARSNDFNLIVDEQLLSGDEVTIYIVLPGENIIDRASNYITDRSSNRILARKNYTWTGKPYILNAKSMDYNLNGVDNG